MDTQTFNRAELLRLYTEFVQAFGVRPDMAWVVIDNRNTMPAVEYIYQMATVYHGATPEAKQIKNGLINYLHNTCGIK